MAIDADDIGGVVTSANGPEARRVGDRGNARFAGAIHQDRRHRRSRAATSCPICRAANYSVWVRGYGLVDSAKVTAKPGQQLNLTATVAPNEAAAAHYYPAIYWYSMLKIPPACAIRRQERHSGELYAERMAEFAEEQWLRRLPSARPAFDPHHSSRAWASSLRRRTPGRAACSPDRRAQLMIGQLAGMGPVAIQEFRRLDRPHRQGRVAARQAACGRRASSAISW